MRSTLHVPMTTTLRIPTLNDFSSDFRSLVKLFQTVQEHESSTFILDFSDCRFLRQNAVAFLGGLARLIEARGGKAIFDWKTVQSDIHTNLLQNGFCGAMTGCSIGWQGNSIPYREDYCDDPGSIANYLENQWLGRGWVAITEDIKLAVAHVVQETYSNAFEHGHSPIGVFSCGQHYPKLNRLKLTVIDFGVGIPHNVRTFLTQPEMSAADALQWAFQPGKTTRVGVPGGNGLDALKEFVRANQGKIEIYSHDGHVSIDKDRESYQSSQHIFEGTLINITVQCKSCYYS